MKVKSLTMQAYPFIEPEKDDTIKAYHPGMTMRDEFAKAAMQIFLQNPETEFQEDAQAAYLMADNMMKARGSC